MDERNERISLDMLKDLFPTDNILKVNIQVPFGEPVNLECAAMIGLTATKAIGEADATGIIAVGLLSEEAIGNYLAIMVLGIMDAHVGMRMALQIIGTINESVRAMLSQKIAEHDGISIEQAEDVLDALYEASMDDDGDDERMNEYEL